MVRCEELATTDRLGVNVNCMHTDETQRELKVNLIRDTWNLCYVSRTEQIPRTVPNREASAIVQSIFDLYLLYSVQLAPRVSFSSA